jgi:hypothetical protein
MHKFHQIPTDKFIPVSHENSYLFNHYDKVANFLAFNLDKNYKNILAKPVQNGFTFDWFSIYNNLSNINEKSREEAENELIKYWEFLDVINAKIAQLSSSSDENSKNWASLLSKVFNHNNNFIFSNGNDICIVWGWKFDNSLNYKPSFSKTPNKFLNPDANAAIENSSIVEKVNDLGSETIVEEPILKAKSLDVQSEEHNSEEIPNEYLTDEIPADESGFLKFLKWFASKFWWLLWVLLLLIVFFLLLKSCECQDNYNDLNTKLDQIEQKANECIN